MALHPRALADLLDIELEQARARLGPRAGDLRREGSALVMTLQPPAGGTWTLRLDGSRYDAEPFDVALVDGAGAVLPLDQWIPGFCMSGTRAYYAHESHYGERWDAVRYALRADSLLNRLLTRAGL